MAAGFSQSLGLKPGIEPQALAEELLTLIQGVLLLGRLYQQPQRLKAGFDQVRRHLREALSEEPGLGLE